MVLDDYSSRSDYDEPTCRQGVAMAHQNETKDCLVTDLSDIYNNINKGMVLVKKARLAMSHFWDTIYLSRLTSSRKLST